MKRVLHVALFIFDALNYVVILLGFVGLVISGVSAMLTHLYVCDESNLLIETFAPAGACLFCLAFLSLALRKSPFQKPFARFASCYWIFYFVDLILSVFFVYFVLYQKNIVYFSKTNGLYYFVAYLGFAVLAGILPALFLLPKSTKKGTPDGGTI
jgi:hypothetical protein